MNLGRRLPGWRYGTNLCSGATFFLSFSDGPCKRGGITLPSPSFSHALVPRPVSLCIRAGCFAGAVRFNFGALLFLGFQFWFVIA